MINNYELQDSILNCIKQCTSIIPEIYFRDDSANVLVVFYGHIPSEEQVSPISDALKEFGTPIANSCREASFVSFLILR